MTATAVILAAGLGTRMKSALPKALHPIAGRPMLRHLIASAAAVFDRIVVVIGPDMEALARIAAPHPTVVQPERLGTAHAALQAAPLFAADGEVAVLYADNPLITPETLRRLRAAARRGRLGAARHAPGRPRPLWPRDHRCRRRGDGDRRMGRRDRCGTRAIALCNAGVLCGRGPTLARWLAAVRADNAKGEYYLTDVVALAVAEGQRVVAVEADRGRAARHQLPRRTGRGGGDRAGAGCARAAMEAGVTLTAPDTVFLSRRHGAGAGRDGRPERRVRPRRHGAERRGNPAPSAISKAAWSGGARHRPLCPAAPRRGGRAGRACRQFRGAEGGEARRGRQGQPSDLSRRCRDRRRHQYRRRHHHLQLRRPSTSTARRSARASSSAPTRRWWRRSRIGDGAFIAAGSVITEDVAPDALAFGRARQAEKPGGGAAIRATWPRNRAETG